jgi:hypothetical protein
MRCTTKQIIVLNFYVGLRKARTNVIELVAKADNYNIQMKNLMVR